MKKISHAARKKLVTCVCFLNNSRLNYWSVWAVGSHEGFLAAVFQVTYATIVPAIPVSVYTQGIHKCLSGFEAPREFH